MAGEENLVRKIIKKPDGYHVYSEDGSKHLGGPYATEKQAKDRLKQVDYFKNQGSKAMIIEPERRVLTLVEAEIRVEKGPNGARKIVGYAAKFGKQSQDLGGFVEQIHEKAFEKALKTADVRGLRNHDPDKILGRTKSGTMRLKTDKTGLKYEIDVPDTQVGRDTITDIERGDLDGSSFSFTTEQEGGDQWDHESSPPVRTLLAVRDLFDVGPVTYPAYLDTSVAARSLARALAVRSEIPRQAADSALVRVRLLKLRLRIPIF